MKVHALLGLATLLIPLQGFSQTLPPYEIIPLTRDNRHGNIPQITYTALLLDRVNSGYRSCEASRETGGKPIVVRCSPLQSVPGLNKSSGAAMPIPSSVFIDGWDFWLVNHQTGAVTFCLSWKGCTAAQMQ